MALVITSIAPTGVTETWTNVAARSVPPVESPNPVGRIIFSEDIVIAALDALNESKVIMSAALPRNFFYRISELGWSVQSTSVGVFTPATGYQLAADADIRENSVVIRRFPIYNQASNLIGADAVKIEDDSVTNDFGTWFAADPASRVVQYFIDGSKGADIKIRWMDTSADATAAVAGKLRIAVMMYTIDQARDFPSNSPTLIY